MCARARHCQTAGPAIRRTSTEERRRMWPGDGCLRPFTRSPSESPPVKAGARSAFHHEEDAAVWILSDPRTDRVKISVGGGNEHFAGAVAVDVGRDRIADGASEIEPQSRD